ncbi:MAG TPA: HAD-IIA family hydrolase [Tepidisphaeraceae bacterium]|nr:HAD-IIA family hydrolase [Tepidisphaeraceae bacterium]
MTINFDLFDAVLLDLDGTVYHEEHALPGAVGLVDRLRAERRKFACLTNSTSSPQRIAERLNRMGISIDPDHVYTAAAATADYVMEQFGHSGPPRVFNLSTEGIAEMLEGKVKWVASEDEACDAVICGVPLNVFATEPRQRTAMLLLRKGAALVAICADRVYPSPRGLEFGVGAMAAMLSYAAGVPPIFCGKPEKLFFDELCHRVGVKPERCVLIGDNLESDIAGAKGVGMKTILTLTGVATREDAMKLEQAKRPDWVIEDLNELG